MKYKINEATKSAMGVFVAHFQDNDGIFRFCRVEPLPLGVSERAKKLETHRPLICGRYCVSKGVSDDALSDIADHMHDVAMWPIANMHIGPNGETLRDEHGDLLKPTEDDYKACFAHWTDIEHAVLDHAVSAMALREDLEFGGTPFNGGCDE